MGGFPRMKWIKASWWIIKTAVCVVWFFVKKKIKKEAKEELLKEKDPEVISGRKFIILYTWLKGSLVEAWMGKDIKLGEMTWNDVNHKYEIQTSIEEIGANAIYIKVDGDWKCSRLITIKKLESAN